MLYRRVYEVANKCLVASAGSAQFVVDAQLYGELGFGDLTWSYSSVYGRNYYMKSKLERAGSGSKLTMIAGNTLDQRRRAGRVIA